MAEKLPFLPFYGFDFYADDKVQQMSWYEQGIYLRLLWEQWVHGSLPGDLIAIRWIARADPLEQAWEYVGRNLISPDNDFAFALDQLWEERAVPMIEECFPANGDGRRRNLRLQRVREEQEAKVRLQKQSGRKAGKASARKRRESKGLERTFNDRPTSVQRQDQRPSTEPEPEPE